MASSRHRVEADWPGQRRTRDSVSGYVYRGLVKYTDQALHKITTYKRRSRNHLVDQIENFRVGDKDNKREDDLLDTFCYGIAISLSNQEGF
jgi:hypothetical protein